MRSLIVYFCVSIFKSLYKLCEWYSCFWNMTPQQWGIFSLSCRTTSWSHLQGSKFSKNFILILENETITLSCNVRKQLTIGVILHKEEQIHQLHQCKNLNTHNFVEFQC